MEIVKDKNIILSNYEVYKVMKNLSKAPLKKKSKSTIPIHLANIAFDVVKYLEDTPCKFQNSEIIKKFFSVLPERGFKLTKAEMLQLVNLRPTTPVEMELIIEDSEERLTEEQIEELLGLVKDFLPDSSEDVCVNGR